VVFCGKLDGNYADLLPPIFQIQHTSAHTSFFFRCCSNFLWEISEKETIEIANFFRCSFVNNKQICCNYP
jgi:hypothetical protein